MTWVVREGLPSICNFKISIWNFTCFSSRNLYGKKNVEFYTTGLISLFFVLIYFLLFFCLCIILLYFLGDFLNFTFQLCSWNFYLCNLVFKFSKFFLVLLIFLFMSSCSWFIDAISPFISLRIFFIVLLFAGFSFLCFLIFFFFFVFHGPFVPIVFSGSVFRSCFQMTGILGCHLFFRSETLGDHFETYKDTEPLKNNNVLDKKF